MTMILFILHVLTVKNGQKVSITSSLVEVADGVHTVFSFTRSDEKFHHRFLSCKYCKRKEMIEISIKNESATERNLFIRRNPADAVYGGMES